MGFLAVQKHQDLSVEFSVPISKLTIPVSHLLNVILRMKVTSSLEWRCQHDELICTKLIAYYVYCLQGCVCP